MARRHRQELRRGHGDAAVVEDARHHLALKQRALREIEYGLRVQGQFSAVDRGFDLLAPGARTATAMVEVGERHEFKRVVSFLLRAGEGHVGRSPELGQRRCAGVEIDGAAMERNLFGQRLFGDDRIDRGADGGDQSFGRACVDIDRGDGKARAAKARADQGLFGAGLRNRLRHQRQQFIRALIAVTLVECLEALQFQHQEHP